MPRLTRLHGPYQNGVYEDPKTFYIHLYTSESNFVFANGETTFRASFTIEDDNDATIAFTQQQMSTVDGAGELTVTVTRMQGGDNGNPVSAEVRS